MEQLLTLLPPEKQGIVEKALQTTFHTTQIESAQFLSGGLSSALVYRIKIEEKDVVLRIVLRRDGLRDPAREHQCIAPASEAGIAPALLYFNSEDGISISKFIPNQGFTPALFLRLVETIKSIHALPLFPPLVGFLDGVDMFIANFKNTQLLPESSTAEHFELYAEIQRAYPRHDQDLVSSHNDLNPGNLIFDGEKLWVIDWESAFLNDRYVDLAIASTFMKPDEETLEKGLNVYFGDELDDYRRHRFFLMRQVCRMYYGCIFLNMAAAQAKPGFTADPSMDTPTSRQFQEKVEAGELSRASVEGQIIYGKILLNEALNDMKTPRFTAAIASMQK